MSVKAVISNNTIDQKRQRLEVGGLDLDSRISAFYLKNAGFLHESAGGIVGGMAGATVGFFLGGPPGAALGLALGLPIGMSLGSRTIGLPIGSGVANIEAPSREAYEYYLEYKKYQKTEDGIKFTRQLSQIWKDGFAKNKELFCPLNLEPVIDGVNIKGDTTHLYERSAILAYIEKEGVNPFNRSQKITNNDLVSNESASYQSVTLQYKILIEKTNKPSNHSTSFIKGVNQVIKVFQIHFIEMRERKLEKLKGDFVKGSISYPQYNRSCLSTLKYYNFSQ